MSDKDDDRRGMANKLIIAIPVLILLFIFKTHILVGFVSIFIDEGGRESNPVYKILKRNSVRAFRNYIKSSDSGFNIYDFRDIVDHKNPEFFEILITETGFNIKSNMKLYQDILIKEISSLSIIGVKRLIDKGVDVNFKDHINNSPLTIAVDVYVYTDKQKNTKYDIVEQLVINGANINTIDGNIDIETPLGYAFIEEDIKIINLLINHGANVHQRDNSGFTYYFYAYEFKFAKVLFDHGLDINDSKNITESTPIMFFVSTSFYDVTSIKFFIESGANICKKDIYGDTFLEYSDRRHIGSYHRSDEGSEFYRVKKEENRSTDYFKYLEKEYNKRCQEIKSIETPK